MKIAPLVREHAKVSTDHYVYSLAEILADKNIKPFSLNSVIQFRLISHLRAASILRYVYSACRWLTRAKSDLPESRMILFKDYRGYVPDSVQKTMCLITQNYPLVLFKISVVTYNGEVVDPFLVAEDLGFRKGTEYFLETWRARRSDRYD